MLVELEKLKPNPLRDFIVDPIDPEVVAVLTQSIAEDGFWGGIVCRQLPDGSIEIGAGHHRVQAALAAGVRTADIFVAQEMEDASMIRVYARENATQRGHTGTALAGTVASAYRFLTKQVLVGDPSQKFLRRSGSIESLRGNLEHGRGLGQDLILDFLNGPVDEQTGERPHPIPGVNNGSVMQQLANLKASGDEGRIIQEVYAVIEAENQEKLAILAAQEEEQRRQEQERLAAEAREKEAERERKEAEAQRREAERERKEAEKQERAAARARKEAEAQQRAAERAQRDAEAQAHAAKEELERRRQAELAQRAEAERLRQVEAARAAEAEQRRQAETARRAEAEAQRQREAAQKAEHDRQLAEAEAALAERRRKEAEQQLQAFESLRQTRQSGQAASMQAKKQARRFDFEGVAQHLKNAHQVDVFRRTVLGKALENRLPVEQQAALAKEIVDDVEAGKRRAARLRAEGHEDVQEPELTGARVRDFILGKYGLAMDAWRREDREAEERARRAAPVRQVEAYQADFVRYAALLVDAAIHIATLAKDWPQKGPRFPMAQDFRAHLDRLRNAFDRLAEVGL
jgi:hypothetical protein